MAFSRSLLTLLLLNSALFAQSAPRPRIGLALGGGGALGLSHVGVLLWLEEHHIPVDVISGTSMGALIGGTYASGMSAAEVKALIEKIDWDGAFRGSAPYADLRFRRKEDRRAFPNRFELGIKNGVRGPSGVTSGFGLTLLLDRIFIGIPANQSFDKLVTPFRCIATDLVSADRVEIFEGSLAEALRASSAIPGLFEPVRRKGQVLVDGGLVDNLPVDSARGMGADIVIASVLPAANVKADDLQGLSILARSVSVAIVQNERLSEKKAQIVIEPDVAAFSASDYEQQAALIEKGIAAAAAQTSTLMKYALNDSDWAEFIKTREARRHAPYTTFEHIEVSGGTHLANEQVNREIRHSLDNAEVPKTIAATEIEDILFHEYGTGRYTSAGYAARVDADGQRTLDVSLAEKLHGPPFIYVNPEVRGEDSGRTDLTVNSRFVFMDLGGQDAELRVDLSIGSHTLAGAEYYWRLGRTGWFLAPRAAVDRRQSSYFSGGKRTADFDIRQAGVGLDFGYTAPLDSEFRLGVDYGRISTALQTGAVPFGSQAGVLKALKLQFTHDGQDSAQVPSHGWRFTVTGRYFIDAPVSSMFPLVSFDASWFHPITEHDRVFVLLRGGTSFGNPLAVPLQFTLGGPLRLSAYGLDEFRGDRIGYSSAGWLHRIGALPAVLGGSLFVGGWYEAGGFSLQGQQTWRQDGTIAFVAETPLGPFYTGWSLGHSGDQWKGKFTFLVGRFF